MANRGSSCSSSATVKKIFVMFSTLLLLLFLLLLPLFCYSWCPFTSLGRSVYLWDVSVTHCLHFLRYRLTSGGEGGGVSLLITFTDGNSRYYFYLSIRQHITSRVCTNRPFLIAPRQVCVRCHIFQVYVLYAMLTTERALRYCLNSLQVYIRQSTAK